MFGLKWALKTEMWASSSCLRSAGSLARRLWQWKTTWVFETVSSEPVSVNVASNMCAPFSVLDLSAVLQSGTNGLGMVPTGLSIIGIDDESLIDTPSTLGGICCVLVKLMHCQCGPWSVEITNYKAI